MDKLKDYKYTMESCNNCGQCRFILGPKMKGWEHAEICPIHKRYLYESYSGQGLINLAQELLEGRLEYEEGLSEHVYTCTTCGACDINCKSIRDMEVLDTILALRAKCVEDGEGPMPVHKKYARHIESSHNIYGKDHARRFNWIPDGVELSEVSDTAYFAGCSTAYLHPDIARDTTIILKNCGMEFGVMNPDEYCCGGPLWRTGQLEPARKLAEHNIHAIKKRGIKTLIVSCAECFGTFRGYYPRISELDFKVLHITEVVHQQLLDGKLSFSKGLNMRVTYHDPCLLGRLSEPFVPWNGKVRGFGYHVPPKKWRRGTNGVYDAPREILKAIPGIELMEMTRHEENAFCCGGGGGVLDAFPDFARWTANERLVEAGSLHAETIVSACPFCRTSFQNAIYGGGRAIQYRDITEMIMKSM